MDASASKLLTSCTPNVIDIKVLRIQKLILQMGFWANLRLLRRFNRFRRRRVASVAKFVAPNTTWLVLYATALICWALAKLRGDGRRA